MKKISVLLGIILVLFISACQIQPIKNTTDIDMSSSKENIELSSIKIKSTFPDENIKEFQKEIEELETKDLTIFDNMKRLARLYKYVWQVGKWIILYENYMKTHPITDVMYNNVASMYDEICKIDDKVNIEYCNNSIKNYQNIIDKYKKILYYKKIAEIYIKIWDIEKAKTNYDLYIKKGGKKDSLVEERLTEVWN